MLTMSDYIESQIQEQAELIPQDQIMTQFMSMHLAASNILKICEYQTIQEFCVSEGIRIPSIIQEGEIMDAISAFFDNLVDWFMGIVRSIVGMFSAIKLGKCISALEKLNKNGNVVMSHGVCLGVHVFECALTVIDSFAEVLNRIELNGELKTNRADIIKDLELIEEGYGPLKAYLIKSKNGKQKSDGFYVSDYDEKTKTWSEVQVTANVKPNEFAGKFSCDLVIEELKKIHNLDIPKSGRGILKKMKFNKDKVVGSDGKKDKEVIQLIRKAANSIASLYDGIYVDTIKLVEKFAADNDIKLSDVSEYKKEKDNPFSKRNGRDQSDPLSIYTKDDRETVNTLKSKQS